MSLARPKRKATANKSYNDTLEEIQFEEDSSNGTATTAVAVNSTSPKKKSSKKLPVSNGTKLDPKITVPYNWQPLPSYQDYFSKRLNLTDAYIDISTQTLYCPHHDTEFRASPTKKSTPIFYLTKGDYIYMISEPPGEPYYVGRIMGFSTKKTVHNSQPESETIVDASDYMFQIQWFYRPRDISKSTSDSRLLFASMHSDTCPFISYRGLITVRHKQDIENEFERLKQKTDKKPGAKKSSSPPGSLSVLESYSQQPDCFYFDKLFDRYMIKFYDILLTDDLLQYADSDSCKSKHFLTALNKRFEFIFVESQRAKSLISTFGSSSCNCEKCGLWCDSPQDTITCVVCKKYYHMFCLDPPLLKKPSRGFSWACALCTKEQEIEYQSKRIVMLSHDNKSSNEKELTTELSALNSPVMEDTFSNTSANQSTSTSQDEEEEYESQQLPNYEIMAIEFLKNDKDLTLGERRLKEEWCMRYLGMHARLEDGVDLEDRNPYPRASTRLGAKHQATNIPECDTHPIVYYDVDKNSKKKINQASKKKSSNDEALKRLEIPKEYENLPVKELPQWLQPRPKGYIERGVDDGEGITSTLLWKSSNKDIQENFSSLDSYIENCAPIATKLGISPNSPNFVDAELLAYLKNKGDVKAAFEQVSKCTKKSLREPVFNREEIKRFESGVKKFGSELHPVTKMVKSQPSAMVVRFYYLWKKTKNGRLIWGNFEGRRHKKLQNVVKDETKADSQVHIPAIDILADPDDDSSYEDDKIMEYEKKFTCKHCNAHRSLKWFRITGHDANSNEKSEKGENSDLVVALCFRCARLWRRYAVEWESPEDVEKKTTKATGWKKKVEAELLRDTEMILREAEIRGGVVSYDLPEEDVIPLENPNPKVLNEVKKPTKRVKKEIEPNLVDVAPVAKREYKKKSTPPEEKPKPVRTKKAPVKVEKPSKPVPKASSTDTTSKAKAVKAPTKVKKEKEKEKVSEKANGKSKEKPKEKAIPKTKVKEEPLAKAKSNPRKKKLKEEPVKTETSDEVNEPPAKKQKKQPAAHGIIDQFMNSNYVTPSSAQSESNVSLDKKDINTIFQDYRNTEITKFLSLAERVAPSDQKKVEFPFAIDSKPCSICLEKDEKHSEMLLCFNCGVNVHSTCCGVVIPDKIARPVSEWLCETCVNDLKQFHSQDYSCSLCYSNGPASGSSDYLKPIYETGKWCHLLCAILNYDLVGFKAIHHSVQPKKLTKDDAFNRKIELINKTIAIETVSNVFLNNHSQRCDLCEKYGGSLIKCADCDHLYHPTCAQTNGNCQLGFLLVSTDKDSRMIKINEEAGMLIPTLICLRHETKRLHSFRTLGKRINQKEDGKPIIQLYLEDVAKTNLIKSTGPQLRSIKYLERYNTIHQVSDKQLNKDAIQDICCNKCQSNVSPIWWPDEDDTKHYICQKCFHNDNEEQSEESPVEEFIDILNRPLDGKFYGIIDENDRVTNTTSIQAKEYNNSTISDINSYEDNSNVSILSASEPIRSKISLGDILT